MNRFLKGLCIVFLAGSAGIACAGIWAWRTSYVVPDVKPEKLTKVNDQLSTTPDGSSPKRLFPVLQGDPFSGRENQANPEVVQEPSQLILLGTLAGPNPRAIMAEKKNPQISYIVSPGDVLGGEKVDMVGKGYVVIWKNGFRLKLQAVP